MVMESSVLSSDNRPLIQVNSLSVRFPVKGNLLFGQRRFVHALTDVSLTINKGETLGIVGESGCGKTTLGNALLGIVKPSSGYVLYSNRDINKVSRKEFIKIRQNMQMIFQDPYSALNPRFNVFNIIAEPFIIRGGLTKSEIKARVEELLKLVGLNSDDMERYPSDFSGGQRQRIGIARAIALNPEFVVCDEPVSALDVSVHAQILNLLMDLQRDLGLTYLFISHNLAVIKKICSNLAVMYLGKIVEYGSTEAIFSNPMHPYTRALMSAVLDIDVENKRERIILRGEIPSPINPPKGCSFSKRCPEAGPECESSPVKLIEVKKGHFTSCQK
jgi:oligopeptide/dipeptide ABC transporter ATP-binding protein